MEPKNLSGLSPIWIISLAMVAGIVVTTMIPVVTSNGAPIKSSDWIGFIGNVVAGLMTIFAGLLAWFSVQKQVTLQREIADRDAVFRQLEIVKSDLHFLQEEVRIVTLIAIEIRLTHPTVRSAGKYYDQNEISTARELWKTRLDRLQTHETLFDISGTKQSTMFDIVPSRNKLREALTDFRVAVAQSHYDAQLALTKVMRVSPDDIRDMVKVIDISIDQTKTIQANLDYRRTLADAIASSKKSLDELNLKAGI